MTIAPGGAPSNPSLRSVLNREWGVPFALFLLLVLFEAMDSNAFGPIIAQVRAEFGLSATQVGLYAGLGSLFGIFITIPVGEFIRRSGYRVAGTAMAGFILAGALISFFAPTFLVALAGRVLTISGTRGCLLVAHAGGSTVAPRSALNTAWALLSAMLAIGGSFGAFFLGGYIGGNYGWRTVMLVIALSTVVLAAIYAVFLRIKPSVETEAQGPEAVDLTVSNPYKMWQIYALGLSFALTMSGLIVNATFASVVAKDRWELGAQFTGTAIGLGQLVSLPFMFLAGVLADRFFPRGPVIAVFVLSGVIGSLIQAGCLGLGAEQGGPTLFTIGVVLCYISQAGTSLIYAAAADVVKPGTHLGPVYAVLSLVAMSGYVVQPILAGILRDAIGSYEPVFVIFSVTALLGLLLLRSVTKSSDRD